MRDYVRPLDRANTRTIDRTGGTILHTSRTNPRRDARRRACRRGSPSAARRRCATGDDTFDLTPLVLEQHRRARARLPGHDRRRRHAELRARARRRGRAVIGDPEDDGQRRPGHRVLHRLLVGDHPRQGADQPPADDARLARADRRLPDLRPRRRVLGAVHGLCHVRPLRDPGGAVRPRPAGRRPGRGPAQTTRAATPSSSRRRARSGRAAR